LSTTLVFVLATGCSTGGYAPRSQDAGDTSERERSPSEDDASSRSGSDSWNGSSNPDASRQPPPDASPSPSGDTGKGGNTGEDANGSNGTCQTGLDGPITRSEVPLKAGTSGVFDVAGISGSDTVPVDTDGEAGDDGDRVWDLAKQFRGDQTNILELQNIGNTWFDGEFGGKADYAMRLSQDPDEGNLGVFRITSDALLMLGVVSPDGGVTRTIMRYEPPAKILEFPLKKGASWKSTSEVSGRYNGTAFGAVPGTSLTVEYRSQVDMKGRLKTPYAPNSGFEVLRVETAVDRRGSFGTYPLGTVRSIAFVTPCFGTVATIRSERNAGEGFEEADEVRRLSTR
jgi:hypothetical protein